MTALAISKLDHVLDEVLRHQLWNAPGQISERDELVVSEVKVTRKTCAMQVK